MTGLEIIAIIGIVLAAAASATSIAIASENAAAQSDYLKKVEQNKATAARQAAEVEREAQADRLRRSYAHQRALLGGAGVVDEGSPLLVMLDSVQQGELALQKITYSGELAARGHESNATLAEAQGQVALQEGRIGAGATLLSGASSAYSSYLKYSRPSSTPSVNV